MAQDNTIDYYLKAAWQSVVNAYNQEASKFGITQASGYVLINISKEGTVVSQIANLLGVRSTSLSRMLNSMERQGLIYREADVLDKRSVRVFLTDLGIEKRMLAVQVVKDFNEYLVQNFSERERVRLAEALQKINKLAQQYALEKK
jgi:DNA-binding MarR family transcriptional regulator